MLAKFLKKLHNSIANKYIHINDKLSNHPITVVNYIIYRIYPYNSIINGWITFIGEQSQWYVDR